MNITVEARCDECGWKRFNQEYDQMRTAEASLRHTRRTGHLTSMTFEPTIAGRSAPDAPGATISVINWTRLWLADKVTPWATKTISWKERKCP